MTTLSALYVDLFSLNAGAIRGTCRDVSDAEALRRPGPGQNPMAWMVGHIAVYRAEILAKIGGESGKASDLARLFGKDVPVTSTEGWPPLQELLRRFLSLHEALVERLRAAGEAAFETKTESGLPVVSFMHFHETYHVGQLGYVRKWLGKDPLVPPGPVRLAQPRGQSSDRP
jgi:hypothetical protein